MRTIICHNKACKKPTKINVAHYDTRDHQMYCRLECADGNNPPIHDKEANPRVLLRQVPKPIEVLRQGYWNLLEKGLPKPQPSLPAMEQGAWD